MLLKSKIYIKKLLESIFEGSYDKDYDIPSEKDIDGGGMITLYRCAHASQIEGIFRNGYNRQFCASNDGSWYGDGVYCNMSLRQAIIGCKTPDPSREEGLKYGSVIVSNKVIGGFDRFLIFNGEIAKKKYGSRYRIKDQVFSLFGEDAKRVWADMEYIMQRDSAANNHYEGRTCQLLQDMFHRNMGRINRREYDVIFKKHNIRGAIYTGGNDGLCAVVYDFSAVIPYKTTTDYGKTWARRFNYGEFMHRMNTKIDVNQRFDSQFKKVYRPIEVNTSNGVESVSIVIKKDGKYNYIDPKTGECLLPLDFDSVTAINRDGDFQVEYNGKLYDAFYDGKESNGFLDPSDGEYHDWGDLPMGINEALDEDGYGKYNIPTEEELDSGKLACVYHVAHSDKLDSIFKTGIHRDFNARNVGNAYGEGAYTSISPKYSREILGQTYGDVIIKCIVIGGFDGFICFESEGQNLVYGREISVREQLMKYLPRDMANRMYEEVGHYPQRVQAYCARHNIRNIRGIIYNWYGDFIAALPFDFGCVIPYSVSYDAGRTFKKKFNEKTLELINRNTDAVYRYVYSGRYKDAKQPVTGHDANGNLTGYSLVRKNNGKYNYVDIHTDKEVLPFDFDSITSINEEDDMCQVEYNGRIYNVYIGEGGTGFESNEDGEIHTWDEFVEYIKNH